jgi:hypothetical protein
MSMVFNHMTDIGQMRNPGYLPIHHTGRTGDPDPMGVIRDLVDWNIERVSDYLDPTANRSHTVVGLNLLWNHIQVSDYRVLCPSDPNNNENDDEVESHKITDFISIMDTIQAFPGLIGNRRGNVEQVSVTWVGLPDNPDMKCIFSISIV